MSGFRNDVRFGPAFDSDEGYNEHVPKQQQRAVDRCEQQLKRDLYKAVNGYMQRVAKLRDTRQGECRTQIDHRGLAIVLHHVAQVYCKILIQGDCSPAFSMAHFTATMGNTVCAQHNTLGKVIASAVQAVKESFETSAIHEAAAKNPNN